MKRFFKFELFIALCAVVFLDRLTKFLVLSSLQDKGSVAIIPGIFHLTFTVNSGAAFSILSGKNTFLIFLSLMVIIFIIYSYFKLKPTRITSVGVGLILGGAISNLLDRFLFSGIVDFIDFRVFPVFNIADSGISIGVIMLIAYYAWEDFVKKKVRRLKKKSVNHP